MTLILASGSPRRAELLTKMGLRFTVRPADVDETLEAGLTPREQVMRLARRKAEAGDLAPDEVLLAADTIVVLGDEILGKPGTPERAREMLLSLSGKTHRVLTGTAVRTAAGIETACEETFVRFRALSEAEIEAYVATGEPMDKAGAYGIQGYAALFIEGIRGDYYNVVGLPVCAVGQMLRRAGIPVLGGLA